MLIGLKVILLLDIISRNEPETLLLLREVVGIVIISWFVCCEWNCVRKNEIFFEIQIFENHHRYQSTNHHESCYILPFPESCSQIQNRRKTLETLRSQCERQRNAEHSRKKQSLSSDGIGERQDCVACESVDWTASSWVLDNEMIKMIIVVISKQLKLSSHRRHQDYDY